jgi:arginyl-tRNA--protein-N-Asp/Glu arginylyltransferase
MTVPGIYLGYKKWCEESQKVKYKSDKERIIELEKKVAKLDSLLINSNPSF